MKLNIEKKVKQEMIMCEKMSLFISYCIESELQVLPQARAALSFVQHDDINNNDTYECQRFLSE